MLKSDRGSGMPLPLSMAKVQLSRYMLKRIIQAGQINAIDVGTGERKHLRLNRHDLDSFIEERRK